MWCSAHDIYKKSTQYGYTADFWDLLYEEQAFCRPAQCDKVAHVTKKRGIVPDTMYVLLVVKCLTLRTMIQPIIGA